MLLLFVVVVVVDCCLSLLLLLSFLSSTNCLFFDTGSCSILDSMLLFSVRYCSSKLLSLSGRVVRVSCLRTRGHPGMSSLVLFVLRCVFFAQQLVCDGGDTESSTPTRAKRHAPWSRSMEEALHRLSTAGPTCADDRNKGKDQCLIHVIAQ